MRITIFGFYLFLFMRLFAWLSLLLFVLLFALKVPASGQHYLPTSSYKYQNAQKVYQDIYRAWGQNRLPPELVMYNASHAVQADKLAKYYPAINRISIGEQLYDLCTTFGPDSLNALACVLGHELAHFFRGHRQDAAGYALGEAAENLPKEQRSAYESEADEHGLFYAFLGGYDTYRVLPTVLEKVYTAYKLEEHSPLYPAKEERIRLAKNVITNNYSLKAAFNAGTFLVLLQDYEAALHCFTYILRFFPSKEIYANAAYCRLMQARQLAPEAIPFLLPITLDINSHLATNTRGATGTPKTASKTFYLQEAKTLLDKALAIDGRHTASLVNMGCYYLLNNNPEATIGHLKELPAAVLEKENAFATLEGIARWQMDQHEKASAAFARASEAGTYTSNYNYRLLQAAKGKPAFAEWFPDWLYNFFSEYQPAEPTYVSYKKERLVFSEEARHKVRVEPSAKPAIEVRYVQGTTQAQTTIETPASRYTVVQLNAATKAATSQGVSIGDTAEKVSDSAVYGSPNAVFHAGDSDYWLYTNTKLIIELKAGKVNGWLTY